MNESNSTGIEVEGELRSRCPRAGGPGNWLRRASGVAVVSLALGLWIAPRTAAADQYDSKMAGHPLRVIAYVVHPVGEILELLIARPAHWLINREPLKTLVGHTDRYSGN